ncbi:ABC transporter ATP-binding protein [Actinomadura madurae]|uniref:ABC transporter ATP-binding protein n=2 Tax=Actinomadura madurae TaxID=1993 RepID=UPI002026D887|nr:ABC transporter ATP-binding protein [Actinomadura madurae]MCP9976634.1 ABC transporter ATP-binding protein [Actinomadura madurae]MCQ0011874.1 ABC transporter ATP-binding protein [Actinomadura madurae]URM93057.1 ABC transporter ATP-binding protein [Actinomadura madurae]URN03783.1 ABC transporter ATP-binding protein [Actinomadura madurae]
MTVPAVHPAQTPAAGDAAAELRGVHIGFRSGRRVTPVVRGVDLRLRRGRVLALVGESGSGKSLTSLALIGLLPPGAEVTSGSVVLDGEDTGGFSARRWREVRGGRVAMVFQDPMAALNPGFAVGRQIAEPFRRRLGLGRREARERAVALMREVGIADAESRYGDHPHRFSGGMRQRAVIAMALALGPSVLLADEPTTALDVTVQAQILRLLARRQREADLATLLVSHDLGVVARVAQDVAVMYAGRIVERGPLDAVYTRPAHPYTLGLLEAVPDAEDDGRLKPIKGVPPDPRRPPGGCAFHPRCPFATAVCREEDPPLAEDGDRAVACHHSAEVTASQNSEEPR